MSDERFLSRWAKRKAAVRQGIDLPEPVLEASEPRPPVVAPEVAAPAAEEPPALTLDDVALLTPEADFAPFVARGVSADVKAAAMKKLFADPHYNIMDGLDIYIGDYTKSDPIPLEMLKQLHQSKSLRLFETEEEQEGAEAEAGTDAGMDAGIETTPAETPEALSATESDDDAGIPVSPPDDASSGAGESENASPDGETPDKRV